MQRLETPWFLMVKVSLADSVLNLFVTTDSIGHDVLYICKKRSQFKHVYVK